MGKSAVFTYDTHDVVDVLKSLRGVQADLRKQTNAELRRAASQTAKGLVDELQAGASGTPQAGIVAGSARVKSDRIPSVTIGGRVPVGSRGTPAGEILWGSERGGHNFGGSRSAAGFWIDPITKRYADGPAVDNYRGAVAIILRRNGVL